MNLEPPMNDTTQLIVGLRSTLGETSTSYTTLALVEITEELKGRIDAAHTAVVHNPAFSSVTIEWMFLTIPGWDCESRADISGEDKVAIEALEKKGDRALVATEAQVSLFGRHDTSGIRCWEIVVTSHSAPFLRCRERFGCEEYESSPVPLLRATAMREADAKREKDREFRSTRTEAGG